MGGPATGGRALEIGCGRGVGVEIILDQFAAASVDAFDLDPRMIERARKRLGAMRDRVRLSVGDATGSKRQPRRTTRCSISASFTTSRLAQSARRSSSCPAARRAVLRRRNPRRLDNAPDLAPPARPPTEDRFDHRQFIAGLEETGFTIVATKRFGRSIGWYIRGQT